ncbi:MAG: hypothetical protein ACO4B6_04215, partial [Ilumatobacteraceae bacterium]
MSDQAIDSAQPTEAPATQPTPEYRGLRWHRNRVQRLGPLYGLALPGVTGLVAIAALVFGQGRTTAVLA